MKMREFTVGSLIPGSMLVKQVTVTTDSDKPEVDKIVVHQNGRSFVIESVEGNLLEVALSQGLPIQYKCRKGTCGQCAVKIIQIGVAGLSEPNEQELKKLKTEIVSGFRLACQAEIL